MKSSQNSKFKIQNYNAKVKIFHFLLSFLPFAFCLLPLRPVQAFTMANPNFILQWANLDTAAGKPTSSNYKLGLTVGENAPGLLSGTNYKIRSGFQYAGLTTPFTFSISQTLIDFGILSPTNPVTRTNSLSISNGSGFGYTVTGFENHPLQTSDSTGKIPDTTCDDGTCSEINTSSWTSTLTFGFGYRCDNTIGPDCVGNFTNNSYFRQFADISKGETTQPVMQGSVVGGKKADITYKVNISGTQLAGTYSNSITYIATPTF